MSKKNEMVDVEVEIKHETNAAVLVTDGSVDAWLPRSLIKDSSNLIYNKGQVLTLTIPEWIAKNKELI